MQAATPLNLSKHRLRCFQLSKEFETVNSLLFRNLQNGFSQKHGVLFLNYNR